MVAEGSALAISFCTAGMSAALAAVTYDQYAGFHLNEVLGLGSWILAVGSRLTKSEEMTFTDLQLGGTSLSLGRACKAAEKPCPSQAQGRATLVR